jgi:hypothetical protein
MKKLVLFSVAMFAFSAFAANKIDFCTGTTSYVKGDLTNMTAKSNDKTLDTCVKNRYADMTTVVSNVLNKTCTDVKNAVSTYCKTGKGTGSYRTETFTYKGKTYNNVLVLYKTTTKCTAKADTTGTNVNNAGERWFFASDECNGVNL